MSDIITLTEKYKQGWHGGLPETKCGHGSRLRSTVKQRQWIPAKVEELGIKTVSDIGAGDLNWMRRMEWDVEYTPYDIVPRHESVTQFDIINQIPQKTDLILCLWVLNHFPYDHAIAAFNNIVKSRSKYLMMTYRHKWAHEQPDILNCDYLDMIKISEIGDEIRLIDLETL